MQNLSSLTVIAIQAALQAGNILRRGFGTDYEVTAKPGRQNFVTVYDKAAEQIIITLIREAFPSHNILAEETGSLNYTTDKSAILWIIDPLDGTTNFTRHIPLFTISIAAYQGETPLCGVIFQPLTHELFVAEKGKGAYLNGMPLSISSINTLENSLLITGTPHEIEQIDQTYFKRIFQWMQKGMALRNLGSAALALAYVASGKAEAFCMHHLYPWDVAAGKLLIEEAGGTVTTYSGASLSISTPSSILVANPFLHSYLLKSFT
jgi:myo-inositol-1(or 4)-monophosphatase